MSKKYLLKRGRHQFAPRSPAIHTNDNLSDEEAEWYLQRYPHIANLFETIPSQEIHSAEPGEKSVQSSKIGVITENKESVQSQKIDVITENKESVQSQIIGAIQERI